MNPRIKQVVQVVLRGISLLIGLSILTFILMKNSPVDPVMASVDYDTSITPEQYAAIEQHLGLDKPVTIQYFMWLERLLSGDMGNSLIHHAPVSTIIKDKARASAALMLISWFLSGVLGIILGTIAALYRGRLIDKMIRWLSYLQVSVPTFWLGLIILLVFSVGLGWFPIGISAPIGVVAEDVSLIEKIHHLILPVLTLSILGIANVALHTREKMILALNSEYVLFAHARGESKWQILKNHAFRNAIVPAITIQFASFGELFGGSVLAEQVFSYPGLGSALTEAGLKSDTPLLLGIVIVGALFVFFGNLIADIINTAINPQLRRGGI